MVNGVYTVFRVVFDSIFDQVPWLDSFFEYGLSGRLIGLW